MPRNGCHAFASHPKMQNTSAIKHISVSDCAENAHPPKPQKKAEANDSLVRPQLAVHARICRYTRTATHRPHSASLGLCQGELEVDVEQSGVKRVDCEPDLQHTAAEALDFVDDVGADNVGILLDAYHMNIEEADPAAAIRQAGDRLWLYHAADSNRQSIGRGHTDFAAQLATLSDIIYQGPIIMECTAPARIRSLQLRAKIISTGWKPI